MNLKAKAYVEAQKRSTQAKLDARRAFLKERGLDEQAVRKDVTVRKLKADLRKSDFRLASIAAQEKVSRDVAKAKAERLAAAKAPKKERKEEAPEKKVKKAKKERPEKQAKSEGKKEKPEEKAEQSQAQ